MEKVSVYRVTGYPYSGVFSRCIYTIRTVTGVRYIVGVRSLKVSVKWCSMHCIFAVLPVYYYGYMYV